MIRKISTHSRKPIGLARKPSQPSPMQRNRPPHGPPAGGGSSLRSCSRLRAACGRSGAALRVALFASWCRRLLRSPLRGARGGPPRRSGGVRLPLAALAGRPPALPALSLGRARSLRSGRRRPPPSLCSVAVGPPGGLVGLPGGPGACSPGALPRRGFVPRLFLFPWPPVAPVALRAAAAAAAAFLIQKVIVFHPFKIPR